MNTCPQCGTEIPEGSNGCQACGWGAMVKLQLSGKAGSLTTAINLNIGKALAVKVVGDESRFMDDTQFMIKVHDERWFIKPYPRVKNPVYVNSTELTCESELNDGDKISLKGKAAFIDVKFV